MATCGECGSELLPGAAFCEVCGAPAVVVCAQCGREQPADAVFCGDCGAAIAATTPSADAATDATQVLPATAPRRAFKPIWIVLIVLLVGAAIAGGIIFFATRDDGGAVVDAQPAGTGQVAAAGDGWVTQWSATDFILNDVSFADALHGWAVGGNADGTVGIILVTTDGGVTWEVQDAGGGFERLTAVDAIDAQTCCAVGGNNISNDDPGIVLMTTDGGSSWAVQTTAHVLNDVVFVDASRGWCVGEYISGDGQCSGVVLATDDGGVTWTPTEHDGLGFMIGVSFVDASTGWVITDTPHGEPDPDSVTVDRTDDGGSTLTKLFETYGYFEDVYFLDDQHGWIAGFEAHGVDAADDVRGVWSTDDGGKSWVIHACDGADYIHAIYFTDSLHGWAVGSGIYATSDGGQTWTQQLMGGGPELFGVAFAGSTAGITVGGDGSILATSDGGVGDGAPQSWDGTTTASSSVPKDEMLAYLKRLQQLIAQARRGRAKLRDAVYGFGGGRLSGHAAATEMQTVIANRSSVLNQVRGIAVPDDAHARQCRAALIAAMQASIGADQRYLEWMRGNGSQGAATPYDKRAGSAKGRFVRKYNALAAQYGLRSDWKVEDL